ncbi:MAG: T9SS type A sorting domain-containing protein [Rhodothermales bacterium]
MPLATCFRFSSLLALLLALASSVAAQSTAPVFDPQTGEPIPVGLEAPPDTLLPVEPGETLTLRQHLPSGSTKLVRDISFAIGDGQLPAFVYQDGSALISVEPFVASDPNECPCEIGRISLDAQPADAVVEGALLYVALRKSKGLRILSLSSFDGLQEVGRIEGQDLLAVAVGGNYAYAGRGSGGIVVYYVADPENPVQLRTLSVPGSSNGVFVADTTLFVATGADGLRTFDLANPTVPTALGHFDTAGEFSTYVVVRDTVAWLTGEFGLIALDVTDPVTPREIGRFDLGGETTYEVAFDGDTAYLAGLDGLRTLDVSDPAAITELDFFPANQSLSVDVYASENTPSAVYLAERFRGLHLLDGGESPGELLFFENGGFAHKPFFDDEILYVTDLGGRLRIFDASGSEAVEIARIDVPPNTQEVFVEDGLAYVTDAGGSGTGLTILDVSDPADPQIVGGYASGPAFGLDVESTGDTVTVYLANGLGGLHVLDVSDPASVTELGRFPVGASAVDVATIDLRQSGLIAYVVSLGEGIVALDVTDPANIVQLDAEPSWSFLNAIHLAEGTGAYVADGQEGLRAVALFPPTNLRTLETHSVVTQARDVTATVFVNVDVLFDVAYVADDFFGLLRFDHGFFGNGSFASSDRGIGVATNRKSDYDDTQNLLALTAGEAGVYLFELPPFPVANEDGTAAEALALAAPFPNPVRGSATLRFSLPDAADVTLAIYDVLGRRVATAADGPRTAGAHEVTFEATGLPSGVYLVRLTTGARQATQRFVIVR